jgi:hypothetical protein
MQRLSFLIGLLFWTLVAAAQNEEDPFQKFMFVEIKGHSGSHLYTGDGLEEVLDNGYGAVEIQLGWQTSGKEDWHGAYGFPSYGVGIYSGSIGNPDILGAPNAVYGFINFPLTLNKRNTLFSDMALGYAYDLKPYDPDNNQDNSAIGARGGAYFNLGLGFRYELNREIDLTYGLDITHISTGRMFQPNFGLNMAGLFLGARYNFNSRQKQVDNSLRPERVLAVRPDYPEEWSDLSNTDEDNILIHGAMGTTQNREDKGTSNRYLNATVTLEYQHFFNLKNGVSAGLDYFHDGSLEAFGESHEMYGFHVGYDYRIWRITIRLQGGSYFSAPDLKGSYFLRPALKFDFTDHLFGQLGLKTIDGLAADWIEFGVGVSLP